MICEDSSHMSVDSSTRSPFKLSPVKLLNNSWLDEVESSTAARFSMDSEINDEKSKPIIKVEQSTEPSNFLNIKEIIKKEIRCTSAEREIELEFLDVSNEEKYDRLIKDEKIKNPFKRRLSSNSNESRSTSPLTLKQVDKTISFVASGTSQTKKSKIELSGRRRTASTGSGSSGKRGTQEVETNEEILSRRQKQIDYGKNTIGYDNYAQQVPRKERTKEQPWTPTKTNKYSRRAWDGLVKVWRKKLHCYDTTAAEGTMTEATTPPDDDDKSSDDE